MSSQQPNKKRKIIQVSVIVIIWLLIAGLVYKHFVQSPEQAPRPAQTDPPRVPTGSAVTSLSQSPSVMSLTKILAGLQKFGDWPVTLGTLGRSNPFLPR